MADHLSNGFQINPPSHKRFFVRGRFHLRNPEVPNLNIGMKTQSEISTTTRSRRLKLPTEEASSEPMAGIPVMPKSLTKSAKSYWPEIIERLTTAGTINIADSFIIAALAQTLGDMLDARASLAKRDGLTYETKTGVWNPYPEVSIINNLSGRLIAQLAKLGLTSLDRAKLPPVEPKGTGEFDEFLFLN